MTDDFANDLSASRSLKTAELLSGSCAIDAIESSSKQKTNDFFILTNYVL